MTMLSSETRRRGVVGVVVSLAQRSAGKGGGGCGRYASLSSFSSRTSLHSSKSFSAKATGRETEDDIKSGKNDERNADTIGVFSKTASSSSAGAFSSSAGAFAGGEEGVDAFEGQEVIDATREETDGQTSIGQTGTVTSIQPGGLLVLEGLRSSVQLGSVLRFPGLQAKAILLSHREPKSFAMLATKLGAVHVPDSDNVAEIKVGDALEVEKMDEENKKSKSKAFQIPPEKDLRGRIVSALGAPTSASGFQSISEAYLSEQSGENLVADPPPVDARKPITTPLITGASAVDVLTPIGRGQCLLVSGEPNTGVSEFLQMSVSAQKKSNVRCVYAAVGASEEKSQEIARALNVLEEENTNTSTTVVTVSKDATIAERYVATLTAFAIAEGARKSGQDALLCVDDFSGMTGFAREMAELAPDAKLDDESDENKEEIEGMLVSAAMAERRRFLGTTLQRVARLNDKLGGGSITLLGAMTHPIGAYDKDYTGSLNGEGSIDYMQKARETVANFENMPEALQKKLADGLKKKGEAASQASSTTNYAKRNNQTSAPENAYTPPRPLVEEFMSITDGQVFIKDFDPETGWIWDQKMSVSRIGAPGQAQAFKKINALELRLQLMQSDDMSAYGKSGEEKRKLNAKSDAVGLFMKQTPGEVRSIAESFIGVYAMTKTSFAEREDVSGAKMLEFANACIAQAEINIADVVESINASSIGALSAEDEGKIAAVVKDVAAKMF